MNGSLATIEQCSKPRLVDDLFGDDTSQDIGDQNQSESSKRGIPKNQPGFNGVIEGASPVGSAGACGNRICLEFDRLTT